MEWIMKKLLIGVLIFSFSVSSFSKNSDFNGFRGILWKDSISKHKDRMKLNSDDSLPKKYYTRENDEMSLGEVTLSSLIYIFYKDKFSSVIVQTDKSITNLTQVLIELKKKFGEPISANKYIHKYSWENENTNIKLKCYSSSHKCSITYSSVKMKNLSKIK